MYQLVEKIDNAKHICIVTSQNSAKELGCGSALYTFLLQKHKKVSWYSKETIDNKFIFLPWISEIKTTLPTSCDLRFDINISLNELYNFFISSHTKINPKMATALYAALLDEYDCFLSKDISGITFALATELIEVGAEHNLCIKNMVKNASLAQLRLEGVMLRDFLLVDNAKIALFCLNEDDFKATGANRQECIRVLKKVLNLPYVMSCVLLIETVDIKKIDVVIVDEFEIKEFKFSDLTMQEAKDNIIKKRSFGFE